MLGFVKQTTLDAANSALEEARTSIGLLETEIAKLRRDSDAFPVQLAEERKLRVTAERDGGKAVREITSKLDAAVADNGVLAAKIAELEADLAASIRNREEDRRDLHAAIADRDSALDRARTENAALVKEHDITLRTLAKVRHDLADLQNSHDTLEAAQARIRREHEDQLSREVAAHAATKRRIEASQGPKKP